MLKVHGYDVFGFEFAVRGMRNPLNSWERSDSEFAGGEIRLGDNDLALMQKLILAGTEHRKFLRMIHVQMEITAPLYWYKEMDTYKVGTVCNSCSTMHRIHDKPFTRSDFSTEHLLRTDEHSLIGSIINTLNIYREDYLRTGDKTYWWQMIQLLPTSYNQRRSYDLNYETLRSIYFQRRHHKLDEWHQLCDAIRALPYAAELICLEHTGGAEES